MKTTEQAAQEYWKQNQIGTNGIITAAFKAGAEFAQQWIFTKDELPTMHEKNLNKSWRWHCISRRIWAYFV